MVLKVIDEPDKTVFDLYMNMSVYDIPRMHPEEASRERAIDDSEVLTLISPEEFNPILDIVRKELCVNAAGVTIIHQDSAYMLAAAGFETGVYRRSTSLCAHAILHVDDVMVVSDARTDERFSGNPFVDDSGSVCFYAAVLLRNEKNLPLGTVCVFDSQPREGLTAQEIACLRHISQLILAVIHRHAFSIERAVRTA